MVEAKGGSRLSRGASYGHQMGQRWIDHWYDELAKTNNGITTDGTDLYNSYYGTTTPQPIAAMVVSLNLQKKKDQLKVGVQAWTSATNSVSPWSGF